MIDWLLWVVLALLVGASFLDLKYKAIPSVLLTAFIFIVAILRIENLQFGILAGLFGWVIKDFIFEWQGLEFGMADIKVLAIIGLLIPNMFNFLIFIGIFSIFQLVYTMVWQWRVGKDKERAFIPCLLAVYIALMLIGGVA